MIVEVLWESKVLEELILGSNRIALADGRFTDALAVYVTLRKLELNWNQIGPAGAKNLADSLAVNKTLQMLDLSFNQIVYLVRSKSIRPSRRYT